MQHNAEDYQKLSLGERVRKLLRQRYGPNAAKKLASLTGVDLRTANGWVTEGREPRGAALLKIIADMGRDGLLALFSPEVEEHEERLRRKISEHTNEVARLKAQLAGGEPVPAGLVAQSPDPSPEHAHLAQHG